MRKLKILGLTLGLVALIILGGCIAPRPVRIKVKVLKPAAIDVGPIRRIAVAPFEGQGGNAVTNRLTAKLFEGERFTLLERQKIGALIDEMGLAEIGVVNPTTAAQLGNALGAEGIIFGSVDGYAVTDTRGRKKVTKYREVPGEYEKIFGIKVPKKEPYPVVLPYTIRYGRVAVTFKMINVETMELLAIKSITREYREEVIHDPDNPKKLRPKGEILDELVDLTTDEFVRLISPHYVREEKVWEYMGIEEGETATSYVKSGLYTEAGEILDRIIKNPGKIKRGQLAAVYYNRGIIYEILGNLNKAEEYYNQACTFRASDLHLEALKRIKRRIEEVKKLQEQQL